MNPIKRLGLWLAGEQRKSMTTAQTQPPWTHGRPYRPPTDVLTTEEAVRRGYTRASVVYACVSLIADTAASVPLRVYDRINDDDWELLRDHPLQKLLDDPTHLLTRRRLYIRTIQHLMLAGNSIWFKIRTPKSGPPTQLWPISPDIVKPVTSARDYIAYYELNVNGVTSRIETKNVIHLQLENPETPWWGIGPLQAAMQDTDLYMGNKAWNLRTVERGAVTPGVLEIPEDITDDQFKAIREQLDNRSFGNEDAGREMILGSGMKYHRMALTGEEIGFLESMRFGREEIAMVFRVPPAMLTPENATLANVEAYNQQFWESTITPLNLGVADILTQALVPDFDPTGRLVISHDYSQVPAMQTSLGEQSETAERLVRMGFSIEGVNRLLDLGFEADEIGSSGNFGNFGSANNENAVETASRRNPRSTKANKAFPLEELWKAADDERQAWEEEVAGRVQVVMNEEAELVKAAWLRSESATAVESAVAAHAPAWEALLTGVYVEAGRHFARREYDRLSPKARKDFDPLSIATAWAERMAALKVIGIASTTIETLAAVITAGLTPDADGFRRTVDDIARDIAQELGGNTARAWTIARTELGAAMNHGHQEGARQAAEEYDLPMVKVWSSSWDDRVRDTHAAIHGEIRELDEPFSNGLQYPGDPNGPASEVVNCRCVVSHRVRR